MGNKRAGTLIATVLWGSYGSTVRTQAQASPVLAGFDDASDDGAIIFTTKCRSAVLPR